MRGLRWKWMATFLSLAILIPIILSLFLSPRLHSYFERRYENRWRKELHLATEYVEKVAGRGPLTVLQADSLSDKLGQILALRVTIITPDGTVVGDSEIQRDELQEVEDHGDRPEVMAALATGFGKSIRFSTTVGRDLLYLAVPLGGLDSPRGVVRIAISRSAIEDSLFRINQIILLVGVLSFVLILTAGFVLSRSLSNRINMMAAAANNFAQGKFDEKIGIKAEDELGVLGRALNRMATDLRSYIATITEERDQLQAILNAMVEGVVVTDPDGKILMCNNAFKRIFDLSSKTQPQSVREVFRDVQLLNALDRSLKQNRDTVEIIKLLTPVKKTLEAHIAVLGPKAPTGLVVVFHDMTRLEQLEKIRRDFVANVSHELRTPLTAIKGFAETLLENGTLGQKKAKGFLETIHKHTDRMAKLVDDLLMLSKLESVERERGFDKIDLKDIVNRIVKYFKELKKQPKMKFQLDLPEQPLMISGVASEIETVVENLIDNAIKYASEGEEIVISGREHNREIQIDVSDKGIGIPVEDQPRIFERFYRVDKGRSRSLGGTGLGLSIVKHVIQRHGGRIWVESEVGKGTTFSFVLPKAEN